MKKRPRSSLANCTETTLHAQKRLKTYASSRLSVEPHALKVEVQELREISGFGLFATEQIEKGEVLFQETPLVMIFHPDWSQAEHGDYASVFWPSHRCHYCSHVFPPRAKRFKTIDCTHCLKAKFCSAECRDQAWVLFHRMECPGGQLIDIARGGEPVVPSSSQADLTRLPQSNSIQDMSIISDITLRPEEKGEGEENGGDKKHTHHECEFPLFQELLKLIAEAHALVYLPCTPSPFLSLSCTLTFTPSLFLFYTSFLSPSVPPSLSLL